MKFWRFLRSLSPKLNDSIQHIEKRLLLVAGEKDELKRQLDLQHKKLEETLHRRTAPLSDQRISEILSTAADTPLWNVVLDLVDRQAAVETDIALSPNVAPEVRTFNAGRAAALRDFESYLVQYQASAEATMRS